jgi:hypothetical protein
MCVLVIEEYEAKRRSGAISSTISEELIVGAAMQQAEFAQAQSMVNGNLNPRQVQEFEQLTHDAQYPKGSTWMEKYGNLALSLDQTSSRAAKQRSQNTHLEGTATAHASALHPSLLELPVAHHCQGKRQTFDIFAPNGGLGLKSPKTKKRGVNMIWDRVFAANALDLSLHKPSLELKSEEKMAQKTAKKNERKDGGNGSSWSFIQASAFQSGIRFSERQGDGRVW